MEYPPAAELQAAAWRASQPCVTYHAVTGISTVCLRHQSALRQEKYNSQAHQNLQILLSYNLHFAPFHIA
jgi:dolichyl-phosphate-mannose--protein O-mannosyl transferase